MSIRRLLLNKLTSRLKVRDIRVNGRPYLERYFLCNLFGIQFYIHRFRASDPEVEVHDHPWDWACSLILLGWYEEETLKSEAYEKKSAGRLSIIRGNMFHRVHFPAGQMDTWTLFFHGKRTKGWGFLNRYTQEYVPFAKDVKDHDTTGWWLNPTCPTGKQLRQEEQQNENQIARPA
jgi:hypothetical protein